MGFVSEIALVIKAGYHDLRPSEQKVADYVLEHQDRVCDVSKRISATTLNMVADTIKSL